MKLVNPYNFQKNNLNKINRISTKQKYNEIYSNGENNVRNVNNRYLYNNNEKSRNYKYNGSTYISQSTNPNTRIYTNHLNTNSIDPIKYKKKKIYDLNKSPKKLRK